MKAVRIDQLGAEPYVANDVPMPEPEQGQLLVRPVFTAINPVYARHAAPIAPMRMNTDMSSDTIMAQTGAMVLSFPFSPGCDTGGVVVKTGPKAVDAMGRDWQVGDRVFGCTRLGTPGHSAWSEYVRSSFEEKRREELTIAVFDASWSRCPDTAGS